MLKEKKLLVITHVLNLFMRKLALTFSESDIVSKWPCLNSSVAEIIGISMPILPIDLDSLISRGIVG